LTNSNPEEAKEINLSCKPTTSPAAESKCEKNNENLRKIKYLMEENKKLKSILESNHIDYENNIITGKNMGKNIDLKEDNNIKSEVTEDHQSGTVFSFDSLGREIGITQI
jgi:hypothetical protein